MTLTPEMVFCSFIYDGSQVLIDAMKIVMRWLNRAYADCKAQRFETRRKPQVFRVSIYRALQFCILLQF